MPFRKGMPKPPNSGRKKGSGNKKKIPKFADYLAEQDINPIAEVLKLLPSLDLETQAKLWMDIASYCQPKPRTEEEESEDFGDDVPEVSTQDLLKLVKGQKGEV